MGGPLPAAPCRRVTSDIDFYRDVARVALAVADKHGFPLGGGLAWVTPRPGGQANPGR
jgi:hypothetical protein